ncbi:hypothetical protein CEE34_01535 [Candidatus Aerophobetes bacterium Ae_b3a]|nr:MAG: hypothetical protein CEE34_01535 [Candidatus Aerophobetes bacterium Ae_b3a]
MPTIRMIDFLSKLNDAYFVVYNTVNIVERSDVQSVIVNTMMQGTDQLLQELEDKRVFYGDIPQKTALKGLLTQRLKDANARKVQEYVPVLLNQNLVMLCTIMEIFFLHILETIMLKEPNVLVGLAQEKRLSLQQVLSLKDYDSIIEKFRSKILDHFSRQGLKEKFKIYENIGLDINKVFDYPTYTDDAQKRLIGYDLSKLSEIFDKRHNIVHKNELPLKELNELAKTKDFFEKIVIKRSILTMDKYAILLDVQDILVHSGYPRDKILPERQRKKEVDN